MPSNTVEVHGVIRDRDGVGVEGMYVGFDPTYDEYEGLSRGPYTNGKGAFAMWLRPGRYRVYLTALDVRVPSAILDTVTLALSSNELNYQFGGIRLRGRLLGPRGSPIDSGSVEAYGSGPDGRGYHVASKIAKGRYTLFIPPSSFWCNVKPRPAYLPSTEGVQFSASADTTIDFHVDGHLIAGRVLVGMRAPAASAEIRVFGVAGPETLSVSASNTTKSDGSYRFYLPHGHYSFAVKPGPTTPNVAPRSISHEVTGPERFDIDLSGVEWNGTVRDSVTRAPLESVAVTAIVTWWSVGYPRVSAMSVSDRKGRFSLRLEPGNRYVLSLRKSDGGIAPKEIEGRVARRDSTFDLLVRATGG